jgi:hypothetical protein
MEGVGQGGISQVHNRLCVLSQPIIEEQGPTPSRADIQAREVQVECDILDCIVVVG